MLATSNELSVTEEITSLWEKELQGYADAAGAHLSMEPLVANDSQVRLSATFTLPQKSLALTITYQDDEPGANATDDVLNLLQKLSHYQESSDESRNTNS